jgi:hypothetical protein
MGTNLLGTEFQRLWKAIRRPMLRWWMRQGIWLLAAIVAFYAVDTLNSSNVASRVPAIAQLPVAWLLPAMVLQTVTMLWAATACNKLLSDVYDLHAVPEPLRFFRARFLLCYFNALVPLAAVLLVQLLRAGVLKLLTSAGPYTPTYHQPAATFATLADAATSQLGLVLGGMLYVAWLVCLLVLMPRRPLLVWLLPLLNWAGMITAHLLYVLAPPQFPRDLSLHPYSTWGWLLGIVVILSLFYAVRSGAQRLLHLSYDVLAAAMLAGPLLTYLTYRGAEQPIPTLLRLVANIPRFMNDSPFAWWPLLALADDKLPASQTLLGPLAHLLPLIVEPLWAVGILALIYYVILGPWPPWSKSRAAAEATSA